MLSWSEFHNRAPAIADAGRKMIHQHGIGLAFLATLRKDGAPRMHPICPTVFEGGLYALIGPSHKRRDLLRDGRFALHSFPCPEVDDEFLVMGRAVLVEDSARQARVLADLKSKGMTSTEDEFLFEFQIDRAMHAAYNGPHGTWPPTYAVWKE
ncbi:MAG: pyridoxamine 5'-phosphate oxidase family protein [Candidatus Binataceae bacterium]